MVNFEIAIREIQGVDLMYQKVMINEVLKQTG